MYKVDIKVNFIFRILIALILVVSSISINSSTINAQQTNANNYNIVFEPNEVSTKVDEVQLVTLFIEQESESGSAMINLVAGKGIEFISFDEAPSGLLAINKSIENGIATLDLASTNGKFSEGEQIASLQFKLTEASNSTIEIVPGSRVGQVEINPYVLNVFAITEEGTAVDEENPPQGIDEQVETVDPNAPQEEIEENFDLFNFVSEQLNVNRTVSIIITVGVVALILILVLFIIFMGGKKGSSSSVPSAPNTPKKDKGEGILENTAVPGPQLTAEPIKQKNSDAS